MTQEPLPMTHERPRSYRGLWRAFPRDLGYVALTGVFVVLAIGGWFLFGAFLDRGFAGVGDLVVLALVVLALLWFGRLFGAVELIRLGWAGAPAPSPVPWLEPSTPNRFRYVVEIVRDPHAWLYLAFTVVVFPALGLAVSGIAAGLVGVALFGFIGGPFFGFGGGGAGVIVQVLALGGAIASLAILPFVTRGGVLLFTVVGTAMLGGFRSEALEAEVKGLEVSRTAAVSAEGTALRRLERDIHDGPQQRLIRLQMDLSAASRAVETDVPRGKELIEEALQQSRDALEELRALSRGFAPPLLLDRGLVAALEAVVDRAAVTTRFTNELPDGHDLPTEIERNAYFIAAELLTNVDKHAGAERAELILAASDRGESTELRIVVTDDGRGGARLTDGHGLAGIEERLTGLGGRLDLRSPDGGPTHVRVHVPVPYAPADTLVTDDASSVAETLPLPGDAAPNPAETTPLPEDLAPTRELPGDLRPTEELPHLSDEPVAPESETPPRLDG